MQTVVEAEGLTKIFGKHFAVDRLGFTVPQGSVVGFLGENGAGKSTTLQMLLGLLRPSAGHSALLGHDSGSLPAELWNRIGYVGEEQGMYSWMTVRQIIRFTSSFYRNWDKGLADQLLKRLDLPEGAKLRELSKGQRGKTALLLALSFHPELLILDDPVSGLDPIVRHEFLEQIIELLQEEGRTVIFSSHILDEVERIADRVLMVSRGRLRVDQSLDELKNKVKRVTLYYERSLPPTEIKDAASIRRDRDSITAVFTDFSKEKARELRALKPRRMEIESLSLNEMFIEFCSRSGKEA